MSEADVIARCNHGPVTRDSLYKDLINLGVRPGMTLIVHSSLSSLGWVCGSAAAVVLALQDVLGEQGTLVMPAHSGDLSDPAEWSLPPVPADWIEIIRQNMPAYDPRLTPTRGMGAIVDTFLKQTDVLRSDHPQLSFGARGPLARQITSNHDLVSSLGEQSPLARLYDLDAWVLLLGVTHENNTSLHLCEHRAIYETKAIVRPGTPMLVNGQRQWVWFEGVKEDADDFDRLGMDFERETNHVTIKTVGYAQARLMRQRPLVDYGVQWMQKNRIAVKSE